MEFFKKVGKAVTGAVEFVGDKNRKAAYLNRLRTVIRCEEKAAEKEYLALGRYYYNNLRDVNNPVTEAHCAEIAAIETRLERTLNELEKFYNNTSCIGVIGGEDSPTAMYVSEGETEEITLDDVQSFDHDPMSEEPATAVPETELAPAEQNENDDLPFEG